jgi:inhibitor of cysteine peptidase
VKERDALLQLNERDHRRKVETRVGHEIELRLPENPTSGHRWRLVTSGESVCSLVSDEFEPGRQPGQPGVHLWRFRIIAAGSGRVELAYSRRWQGDAPAADTFSLEVKSEA